MSARNGTCKRIGENVMKCLICGEKTNNTLLCEKHIGVDACLKYLTVHNCMTFEQKIGEPEGICKYRLKCEADLLKVCDSSSEFLSQRALFDIECLRFWVKAPQLT